MEFGKPANIEVPNFNTIDEIVVVSPHAVTFKRDGADDLVIESSGSARADQVFSQEPVEYVDSVPVYELTYTGEVVGLPDPVARSRVRRFNDSRSGAPRPRNQAQRRGFPQLRAHPRRRAQRHPPHLRQDAQ